MGVHPTHKTRMSDSSSFDEICIYCGATDGTLTWGKLALPCPKDGLTAAKRQEKMNSNLAPAWPFACRHCGSYLGYIIFDETSGEEVPTNDCAYNAPQDKYGFNEFARMRWRGPYCYKCHPHGEWPWLDAYDPGGRKL